MKSLKIKMNEIINLFDGTEKVEDDYAGKKKKNCLWHEAGAL
jgi:hypothetical protein